MEVNGFSLPAAYVQICQAVRECRSHPIWVHVSKVDAHGRPWEAGDVTFQGDESSIREETEFLRCCFREGGFHQNEAGRNEPGFAADFTSASNLVWLGNTGSGKPFCFDFGETPEDPSIIFWETAPGFYYWRRVAPNFDRFIALFRPANSAQPDADTEDEWTDEEWNQALTPYRSLFEAVAAAHAQRSPGERRKLEEQIREALGAQELDVEQRREIEKLMERLQSGAERELRPPSAGAPDGGAR